MTYLPSRKFGLYTLSVLIAGALVALAVNSIKPESKKPRQGGDIVAELPTSNKSDRDGDGLLDWEEFVAHTDPLNPDTNGDGIKDGEEQKALKAFYADARIEPGDSIGPVKSLMARLPELLEKSPDGQINDGIKKEVSDLVQAEVGRLQKRRDPFAKTDVLTDETKPLRAYINEIADITDKHFPGKAGDVGYENEITILAELAERVSKDQATKEDIFESLDRVEAFRHRYISATNDLRQISVPIAATEAHLKLLNFFANTGTALEEIASIDRDLVVGVIGMQHYSQELAQSRIPLLLIKRLVDGEKLTFSENEPGKLFFDQYLKSIPKS